MYHITTKTAILPFLSFCICTAQLKVSAQAQPPAQPTPTAQKQPFRVYNFSGDFSVPGAHLSPPPQALARSQDIYTAIQRGEVLLKSGDSDGAIGAFNRALAAEPHDGLALQRLAEAYTVKGQTDQALATYRTLLYPVPGQNWGNSNATSPTVLMHFALLLLQKGQAQEALTAYHRAVYFLDYDMGRPSAGVPVPIPDIGDSPGQLPYTPQTLEAMAHLALGVDTFSHLGPGDPEPLAHFRQAVQLAPDSAAACYYLGKCLYAMGGSHGPEARAMLEKAVQFGDDQTAREANIYLKMAH